MCRRCRRSLDAGKGHTRAEGATEVACDRCRTSILDMMKSRKYFSDQVHVCVTLCDFSLLA